MTPEPARTATPTRVLPARLWPSVVGAVVLAALSCLYISRSIDGYQAGHGGVAGTVVVTGVAPGELPAIWQNNVVGDFTPAQGGRVQTGVFVVVFDNPAKDTVITVDASSAEPSRVYPPGSMDWTGNAVIAFLCAVILAVALLVIRYERRRRRAEVGAA